MTEIKDKIIDAFEATRESPRDFFEPESLVQYLLKKPKGKNGIHNSFKGKRKLGDFLKELEANFIICFSLNDGENLYSLEQIEKRVSYLLITPKSSLISASNIIKQRPPDMLALALIVISLPIISVCYKLWDIIGLISLSIPFSVITFLFKIHYKEIEFYKQLQSKIKANKVSKRTT